MKVVLVNGSRRDAGCTYTALSVVAKELEAQGIDTEIVAVGSRVVKGELDAVVKEVGAKITDADGLIVGSPVYYASPTGEILMFLDRLLVHMVTSFVTNVDLQLHLPAVAEQHQQLMY